MTDAEVLAATTNPRLRDLLTPGPNYRPEYWPLARSSGGGVGRGAGRRGVRAQDVPRLLPARRLRGGEGQPSRRDAGLAATLPGVRQRGRRAALSWSTTSAWKRPAASRLPYLMTIGSSRPDTNTRTVSPSMSTICTSSALTYVRAQISTSIAPPSPGKADRPALVPGPWHADGAAVFGPTAEVAHLPDAVEGGYATLADYPQTQAHGYHSPRTTS